MIPSRTKLQVLHLLANDGKNLQSHLKEVICLLSGIKLLLEGSVLKMLYV